MAGDDDSRDDERTRIGGLPPGTKPVAGEPAKPASPAAGVPDEGERTQIAPQRPPSAPGAAPGVTPPPAGQGEEAGERTQIAGGTPPRATTPAGAAAPAAPAQDAAERTQIATGGPPGTPRAPQAGAAPAAAPPAAAPAAPPPAAPAPAAPAPAARAAPSPAADATVDPVRGRAGDDEERTVVLPRRVDATIRLKRVAPSGQTETIVLDRPSFVLGRGHGCEVKLFTPTASREHARIFFQEGRWRIAPLERKSVYLDGRRMSDDEVALDKGTRVRLGDDELVVEDATGAPAARASGGGLWARVVAFVKGLVGRRG